MLSCSIQNVLLSFLLSRHIHNIFTASVHREFESTQHSEIAIPPLSEKGEGLGQRDYWVDCTVFMASL